MNRRLRTALADRLAGNERVVEVGVGRRTAVAAELVERGVSVTATDVTHRETPAGVEFVRDDVTDPDPAVYEGAGAVYALNLPPELHRPVRTVGRRVGADVLFTTLGGDQPAIPVTRETLPGGETLYVAEARGD